MLDFKIEKYLFSKGYKTIGSIDEAGRGPLAGPVVAACVVLKPDFKIKNKKLKDVKDSKKLTAKKRNELFDIIHEEIECIGVGICDNQTIDRINILQASFLAMKKALGSLKEKPHFTLVDGRFLIPNCSFEQKAIIKGDEKIFSIATASIIAKVTRDRIMEKYHEQYPQYNFNKHKGYGTKTHLEALEKFGPCPIHRFSFKRVK